MREILYFLLLNLSYPTPNVSKDISWKYEIFINLLRSTHFSGISGGKETNYNFINFMGTY